jgi:hypothetical protein
VFLISGFAATLGSCATRSTSEPSTLQACALIFGWCLILVGLSSRL